MSQQEVFLHYRKALGLLFIWRSFVFCLLFLLFYVICALVPAEGTSTSRSASSLLLRMTVITLAGDTLILLP